MNICEIFKSIQGEGLGVGEIATFVRLSGCNLRCTFCDTKYAWTESKVMEPVAIAQEVHKLGCQNVVITGGEPLAQDLTGLLWELRHEKITIETNGTIYFTNPRIALMSISPKLSNSGQVQNARVDVVEKLCRTNTPCQLKFVVDSEKDIDEAISFCQKANVRSVVPIVFQPNNAVFAGEDWRVKYLEKMNELVEIAKKIRRPNVYVIPQVHYLIWNRVKGK